MTPVSDRTSQMVQFCLRNDTEADTPADSVIAFERAVTLEDKRILESTDYDVPLGPSREEHMFTGRPGIMIRKRVEALLKAHGEIKQVRALPDRDRAITPLSADIRAPGSSATGLKAL